MTITTIGVSCGILPGELSLFGAIADKSLLNIPGHTRHPSQESFIRQLPLMRTDSVPSLPTATYLLGGKTGSFADVSK